MFSFLVISFLVCVVVSFLGRVVKNDLMILIGIVGMILIVIFGFLYFPHFFRTEYNIHVTRLEGSKFSRMVLGTEIESGKGMSFKNRDSALEWKWNSADIQAELEEGKDFTIKVYGIRLPFWSVNKNIISVEPYVRKPDPEKISFLPLFFNLNFS